MSRLYAALLSGTIAIVLNTLALAAADLIPLATAHGGLLRFLVMMTGGAVKAPTGSVFQTGFHLAVGVLMALFYAYALEPRLPGPDWARGLLYAAAVWLVNALIVLPAIGEGIAGSRNLTVPGLVWYAVAHTLFFVAQAVLYARLRRGEEGGRL